MKVLITIKSVLKPPLRFFGNAIVPFLTAFIIWDALDNVAKALAVILLIILVLKNLGFNVNLASKFRTSKIGRALSFIARSSNSITKMDEDYFKDTSIIIADQTKRIIKTSKKIKEDLKLKKVKSFREEILLWLMHNKKQILAYLTMILFAIDYYFGFTRKLGLSPDAVYTIAAFIFVIALWVMGGEGWTSNTINRVKANKKVAEKESDLKIKKYRQEVDSINKSIDEILLFKTDNQLPPDKEKRLAELRANLKFYEDKLKTFEANRQDKRVEVLQ